MSTQQQQREVIHISVGNTACQVTANWSNLQGLAATSDVCHAGVTHSVYQDHYVPRVLLVDHPAAFVRQQQRLSSTNHQEAIQSASWSGTIESQVPEPSVVEEDPMALLFLNASTIAYGPTSRYKAPVNRVESQYSSSGRQVNWDDEDMTEEDEDEIARQRQRQERQRQEWYVNTHQPLQAQMENQWGAMMQAPNERQEEKEEPPVVAEPPKPSIDDVPWVDYWLPPFHPKSCLPLPFDSTVDDMDRFTAGYSGIDRRWKDDELVERLRNMLEDCDACQGVVLTASNDGWAAGLTCSVLEELQDECPSVQRMVTTIQNEENNPDSLRTRKINAFRTHVETGLAMHHYRDLSHLVLPLELPTASSKFQAKAWVGAALEAVTLPYRVGASRERSLIGMNSSYFSGSYGGDLPFGTASSLSFREFLYQLRPSTQLMVAELDLLLPRNSSSLDSHLLAGTSLERDTRMRQGSRNKRLELPGKWLDLEDQDDGLLTSLSPLGSGRSQHRHFAGFAAMRYPHGAVASHQEKPQRLSPMEQQLTCLMEGLGPRYRTEQSSAVVVHQGIRDLTHGAGSYWKHVWNESAPPLLACATNSTRRFAHLDQMATDMRKALRSSRVYYNRDVQNGILPETEDCDEALATCLDLRDAYMPPDELGMQLNHHF